jgi:glycosyltransferase involved in cell wall biosynthesis
MSPRVVIAAPLFNKAAYLGPAVRSLLAQTYTDFALLLIDDRSDDETLPICEAFAAEDARVEVHLNERRLGMLGNTNRSLSLARERFPDAEFWALGSDHDLWEPRWLETLVGLLDAHPDAVLALSQTVRIDEHDTPYDRGGRKPWRSQTLGIDDQLERLRATFRGMVAGDMIYGLFRVSALADVGTLYRPVLVPDRLLLTELSLRGTSVQAPEVLWRRRFRGLADLERQRRSFFLDQVPRYARTPWWVQHTGAFVAAYALRAEGRPGIGRLRGVRLALEYLRLALALRFRRRLLRLRRRVRRYRPRRIVHRGLSRLLARVGPSAGAGGRRMLERMEAFAPTRPLAARLRPPFDRLAGDLNARGRQTPLG